MKSRDVAAHGKAYTEVIIPLLLKLVKKELDHDSFIEFLDQFLKWIEETDVDAAAIHIDIKILNDKIKGIKDELTTMLSLVEGDIQKLITKVNREIETLKQKIKELEEMLHNTNVALLLSGGSAVGSLVLGCVAGLTCTVFLLLSVYLLLLCYLLEPWWDPRFMDQ
ncbi:hypothetical protein M422DRAFT_250313 [Sphaerobolus stellatus SS14]|uniref:Uncharacterized protein n=1 Tax=Sphaerobolus stellatus (strain SS14) TaxID=990650 RepID=A0A0C9UTU8_SPHS4|nr:hypothetical protein M422DRAFT_250313 [Sphaerobolus stellatus SS14]